MIALRLPSRKRGCGIARAREWVRSIRPCLVSNSWKGWKFTLNSRWGQIWITEIASFFGQSKIGLKMFNARWISRHSRPQEVGKNGQHKFEIWLSEFATLMECWWVLCWELQLMYNVSVLRLGSWWVSRILPSYIISFFCSYYRFFLANGIWWETMIKFEPKLFLWLCTPPTKGNCKWWNLLLNW